MATPRSNQPQNPVDPPLIMTSVADALNEEVMSNLEPYCDVAPPAYVVGDTTFFHAPNRVAPMVPHEKVLLELLACFGATGVQWVCSRTPDGCCGWCACERGAGAAAEVARATDSNNDSSLDIHLEGDIFDISEHEYVEAFDLNLDCSAVTHNH